MLSAWDKFGVVAGEYSDDPHSEINCTVCHGGDATATDKDAAHANTRTDEPGDSVIADPSAGMETCGRCHAQIASTGETSVHSTFHGYRSLFERRAGFSFASHPGIEEEFSSECGSCHTTCGQCHVSLPNTVQGGLMEGHVFKANPNTMSKTSFKQVCTACHSSRIEEEFYKLGSLESVTGYRLDTHYYKGYKCTSCHTASDMHGDGMLYGTRYASHEISRCEDCHSTVSYNDASVTFGSSGDNLFHRQHGVASGASDPVFQCQVCHSQQYKNCNSCHVSGGGITGSSYLTFKIGLNPIKDVRPEYDYVVLRHIPIAPDTYEPWGISELANYSALPSWKYASPHNILRFTARTDTTGGLNDGYDGCRACHNAVESGNDWFLRASELDSMATLLGYPEEVDANQNYVVDDAIPSQIP